MSDQAVGVGHFVALVTKAIERKDYEEADTLSRCIDDIVQSDQRHKLRERKEASMHPTSPDNTKKP